MELAENEITFLEGAYPAVWIKKTGTLKERLQAMRETVKKMRIKMINTFKAGHNWTQLGDPLHRPLYGCQESRIFGSRRIALWDGMRP